MYKSLVCKAQVYSLLIFHLKAYILWTSAINISQAVKVKSIPHFNIVQPEEAL